MWYSDNGWKVYSDEQSAKLEKALAKKKGVKKIDDTRLVDLEAMVQRRIDDPAKKRSVKRVSVVAPSPPAPVPAPAPAAPDNQAGAPAAPVGGSTEWFDGMVFYFLSTPSQSLLAEVEAYGGLISRIINKRVSNPFYSLLMLWQVTHIVCDQETSPEHVALLEVFFGF